MPDRLRAVAFASNFVKSSGGVYRSHPADDAMFALGLAAAMAPSRTVEFAGFTFARWPGPGTARMWLPFVPYWALAAPPAVLPVWWALTNRRRERQREGHCRRCGYDLRGPPTAAPSAARWRGRRRELLT